MSQRKLEIRFVFCRETPNTRVYSEVERDKELVVLGDIYLQKSAMSLIGNPERILVTIEANKAARGVAPWSNRQ